MKIAADKGFEIGSFGGASALLIWQVFRRLAAAPENRRGDYIE
jgi:hypothetical protein